MRKGSRKKEDEIQAARRVVDTIIAKTEADAPEEAPIEITPEMRAAAAAFGRIGGKIGGPKRAAKLTLERRSEIAKKAAAARWGRSR
jgi:hypothetical protein